MTFTCICSKWKKYRYSANNELYVITARTSDSEKSDAKLHIRWPWCPVLSITMSMLRIKYNLNSKAKSTNSFQTHYWNTDLTNFGDEKNGKEPKLRVFYIYNEEEGSLEINWSVLFIDSFLVKKKKKENKIIAKGNEM